MKLMTHFQVCVCAYMHTCIYICRRCICWWLVFKPQGPQLKCQQTVMSAPPGRQTYKDGNQKSAPSRRSLIERRMLFQRLPTEVQLSKQRSVRAIHVLAVCQYHIHHLPVLDCCASKSLTPLLIYNLNFEVHPVYPWILVFFIALSLIWLPVLSPNHPIWLSVLFLSVFWRGPPFLFEIRQLPLCFNPHPPSFFLSSCRHSIA